MNKKISIIVPVYNTENYLRKCIDSVIKQEYKDWELILVDDGSTDISGKICDEYAAKDQRILVEHKNNTGVSDTRNHGIDASKGDWIFFLDSDDELFPNSLSSMMEWSKDADMVVGVFKMNITDPNRTAQEREGNVVRLMNKNVNSKGFVKCLMDKRSALAPTVFPKLYKTNIIRQHHLHFDANIYYAEDQLFLAQYLCCKDTKRIHINNVRPVYQYNIWFGNATSKMGQKFNDKLFTDFVGYFKIYDTYHATFCNKKIDKWAKLNAYKSAQRILDLMDKSGNATDEKKSYIEKSLLIITDNGKDTHVIKRYKGEQSLMAMKHKAATLSRQDRIKLVNKWLHSKDVCYDGLNDRWKKLYILSHILGTYGVDLVIDRIGFDV